MKLIFATNNENKVREINAVVPDTIQVISLQQAGIHIDIPEPHQTLEENAVEKAATIYTFTGEFCFSEDTGLEVTALNGEPGVKSARYAGDNASSSDNINKLLGNLKSCTDRSARFKTVICLIINGQQHFFEGLCNGTIITQQIGNSGFGYDPVFIPDGSTQTFAQMNLQEKNTYSHRRKAVDKLVVFLTNLKSKHLI